MTLKSPITGGKIIGADYEVDEEWLDRLGGSPVTLEEAKQVVQSKVPASGTENIRMWEESDDGRADLREIIPRRHQI